MKRKVTFLKLMIATGLVVLATIALYPWKTTVVPEWRLRIIDESSAPLTNTAVREIWRHYDIESQTHRQDLMTDNRGYVTFPEQTVRGPLAVRFVRRLISSIFPHQSSGPDAFVIVLAAEYDVWSNNSAIPGQPLPTEIVVKRNR